MNWLCSDRLEHEVIFGEWSNLKCVSVNEFGVVVWLSIVGPVVNDGESDFGVGIESSNSS